MDYIKSEEKLIFGGGVIGRHRTLCITNKRLLFLHKKTIEREIHLSDILEVYPQSQGGSGLTQLVIRRSFQTEIITFHSGEKGNLSSVSSNDTDMASKYVGMINELLIPLDNFGFL
ncbi:MAG: PH domain-containing protein [Candidatus Bathyarchaeia archaeon]|jgi:hypothetical protein